MSSIVIIGELNLDFIVTGAPRLPEPGEEVIVSGMELTLGSSSAILAAQLARLGDDVLFISKVGADEFGSKALESLRAKGVSTDAVAVVPLQPTGLTISIAVGTERAMLTQLGCIEEMRWEDVDFERLRGRQHLHISSFYLQRNLRPGIGRAFEQAKRRGMSTSLDTGWPSDEETNGDLAAVWPHLDVFLPNEAEAKLLARRATVDEALSALSARVFTTVVKMGAKGAVARQRGRVWRRSAFAVDPVDTTGAGDSFNGGFLHGYLEGWDMEACLDLGNACGALSTRAAGGTSSHATLKEALELVRTGPRRELD
jgi:sugar/nucleoside kinase (ribokinase family)